MVISQLMGASFLQLKRKLRLRELVNEITLPAPIEKLYESTKSDPLGYNY
jgi:hypothetical protein